MSELERIEKAFREWERLTAEGDLDTDWEREAFKAGVEYARADLAAANQRAETAEQRAAALHSLVCNAYGYDKSIVRGLALHVRQTASDGFYKDLAQRVIDAETRAGVVSRCSDVHPLPDAIAASGGAAPAERASAGGE